MENGTHLRSPKNQDELTASAEALHCQLLKIGCVFSVRWVSSSYRTVKAMWQSYKAIWEHFGKASCEASRSSAERAKYESSAFVNNLGLLMDSLLELAELSLELQN